MYETSALKEEWDVFKILCPKEIADVYLEDNIKPEYTAKLVNMMSVLGFTKLAAEFTDLIFRRGHKNILLNSHKEDSASFIKLFLQNIKSDGLRERFSKKASRIIDIENFEEYETSVVGKCQEWEILKILYPKILEELLFDDDNCMKFILALEYFGFSNFANEIYLFEYAKNTDNDIVNSKVYDELPKFKSMFLSEIKSDGLRKVFS